MKILLKGYFGFGNLGDDLLMITSFNIIRECFPNSQLYINSKNNYVSFLLNNNIKVIPKSDDSKFDLIVFGGGGVFHCTKKSTIISSIKDFILKLNLKIKNKPKYNSKYLVLSVGIGPYYTKKLKYYIDMRFLSQVNFLSVRDKESYNYANKFNASTILSTDLVFGTKYWLEYFTAKKVNINEDYILFIVRDWNAFDNRLTEELNLVKKLNEKGKEVRFMLFNPENDKRVINTLKYYDYNFYEYNPNKISETLNIIQKSKVIITQRAHGAIIGSILKVPVFCLGIEPKLLNVHEMLKGSSYYIEYPINIKDTSEKILDDKLLNKMKNLNESIIKTNSNKIDELVFMLKKNKTF